MYIFILEFKKGNVIHIIALILHASKILLRISQKCLQPQRDMPIEDAGVRKGHGTSDQITIGWIKERVQEYHRNVYLCFIDISKAFSSMEHLKMWNSMRSIGIPEHLLVLIEGKKPKCRSDKARQNGCLSKED
jgi:hypothetical protein